MKVKKILKIILVIFLIAFVLLAIHTIRNYIIIRNLQKAVTPYLSKTNFMTKFETQYDNNNVVTTYYYEKDGNQRVQMERKIDGETTNIDMYNKDGKIYTFTEKNGEKTYTPDNPSIMHISILNLFEADNNWQTFLMCIPAFIKNANYNGKDVYTLKNLISPYILSSENISEDLYYVEKDTGLFLEYSTTNEKIS